MEDLYGTTCKTQESATNKGSKDRAKWLLKPMLNIESMSYFYNVIRGVFIM